MELAKYLLKSFVLFILLAAGSVPFESCFESRLFAEPVHQKAVKFLVAADGLPVAPVSKNGEEHPVVVERISHSVQVFHFQLVQPVIFILRIFSEVRPAPLIGVASAPTGAPELRRLFHHIISRQAP